MRLKQSDLSKHSKYGSILEKKTWVFIKKSFVFWEQITIAKLPQKSTERERFLKTFKNGVFSKKLVGFIGGKSCSFLKSSKVADLLYIATETVKFLKLFKIFDFLQKKKVFFGKKLIEVPSVL